MSAVFAFLSSIFALGTSGAMAFKAQNEVERANQEYLNNNYNYSVQIEYERNSIGFDLDKVIDAIKNDYPNISEGNAYEVAFAAIAKRKMEEETNYKYEVRGVAQYFELDKYATDEFKVKK